MKKWLWICAIVLLLTGCDVEYQLSVIDNKFHENIQISLPNTEDNQDLITQLLDSKPYAFYNSGDDGLYKKTIVSQKNPVTVKLEYDYTISNYQNANVLHSCYESYNVLHYQGIYHITTGERFNCMVYDYIDVDKVIIKFHTNHKVISTNADRKDGNTYIWEVDESNADHKPIDIQISDAPQEVAKFKLAIPTELLVVLAILVIVGIIIFIVIRRQNKKNNEI